MHWTGMLPRSFGEVAGIKSFGALVSEEYGGTARLVLRSLELFSIFNLARLFVVPPVFLVLSINLVKRD